VAADVTLGRAQAGDEQEVRGTGRPCGPGCTGSAGPEARYEAKETIALLTGDAWLTMPPVTPEYKGPDPHAPMLRAYGPLVLSLEGDKVAAITRFADNSVLPYFGLPRTLAG
jgi:hypothetical protein